MEWLLVITAGLVVELLVIVALGRRATGAYGTPDQGAPGATPHDRDGALLLHLGTHRHDEGLPPEAVGA
ncbi:hypothetical protein E9549_21525 [Blastococcus sp. MG754426]|uniref:hypothetical protein n=1 Tax=unclassified Blastococcus TaxID=2619396 RepID=UPI001EF0E1FD|nr:MULTISPECIES: hypothetical protein [unclassified Blastococcus]MCF6509949.1 hypothetical protein [Blastococcus sp. MG754426]MCF6514053.1 hypothetical protein [Blastococcus sp. MG754427]MCF6737138.1 hypothetical protein [Blastococcus sp. KM273129]